MPRSRRNRPANVDGFLVVDKPAGMTSHDVVARCRKVFGQRQVGHGGTLDPDATGVLVVALGAATRLLRFVTDTTKVYRAVIVFGVATDTLDASGRVIGRTEMHVDRAQLDAAVARFTGPIQQVPPMVSAVKVGGRRLHELAREGTEVERAPRTVTVHRFEVEDLDPAVVGRPARATVLVECSSGTYVRSLAADLGTALGGLAHVAELRRLAVGRFDLAGAHPLDEVEQRGAGCVLPIATALRDLPRLTVDDDTARTVAHGATLPDTTATTATTATTDTAATATGPIAVCDESGEVLAVYEPWRAGMLKPSVVLVRPVGAVGE